MTVTLVINEMKDKARSLASKAVDILASKGHVTLMLKEEAAVIGKPELAAANDQLANSDLLMVLGGDGTILRAAREIKGLKAPLLGVNLGTLGFLATVEPDSMEKAVDDFGNGDYFLTRKKMLDWQVLKNSDILFQGQSLNDAAISRQGNQRIIQCDIYVNDKYFLSYAADGIIFASPTGSTAYSLSAGGPLVAPQCEVLIMTPVSPHSLFDRSVLISPKDTVRVQLNKEASLICDGQTIVGNDFDSVKVSLSDKYIDFVEFEGHGFYRSLREKLRINEPLQF